MPLSAPEEEADKGDIFETDFEIPPMEAADSGSEAVALESDTDLEKSDVDVVEDAERQRGRSARGRRRCADHESKGPEGRGRGCRSGGRRGGGRCLGIEGTQGRQGPASRRGGRGRSRRSGGCGQARPVGMDARHLPVLAFPFMILGGIMAYQLLETTWGYQQPRKPTAPLVGFFAKTFDMELREQ